MAMVPLGRLHVPIVKPLLKLAGRTDLVGRKLRARGRNLLAEVLVAAQNLGGANRVVEQVADDLLIHRRAGADARAARMAVLGRE